ncbi:helix-turn-helix domain-containing protein [Algoriphagus pacificus]|uniref:AraC family transcriptional regulator n=1 Tax=Algoriphagus pacificus TaxID=2811234 RepID=A0ABS3CIE9_9BACT|nr:helix-turn-helix domain-containing protein [Algoriphagus pacificus]MBN7816878.1 AraC family transcriptional regulator [Algoriphagus pacificus]
MEKQENVRLRTVSQFNEERGQKTLHPLITVLDQSKSSLLKPTQWLSELYIIFYKDKKCSEVKYGRQHYDYQDGTMMFISPGQIMGIEEDGLYQPNGWALAFHPDFLLGTSLNKQISGYGFFSYQVNEALHLSEMESEVIFTCFRNILNELSQNIDTHSKKLVANNVELLLNYSSRFYERQFITREHVSIGILEKFEKSLFDYYHSDSVEKDGLPTVGFFANELHLSSNYFGDLIKKQTGKSAREFIQDRIIEISKDLLLDNSNSVSDVAYQIGFKHPQHFSRLFKRYTGKTPQEYQNLN